MNKEQIKEAFRKEDKLPFWAVFIVLLGCATSLFSTYAEKMLNQENPSIKLLAITGIIGPALLILFIISIKRAIQSLKKTEQKMDERETMHEYILARSGYNTMIVGTSLYLIIIGADTMSVVFFTTLIVVTIIIRLRKRQQLEKEN